MMMAQNATDGKLEKLLGAATDLFDFVQQSAEATIRLKCYDIELVPLDARPQLPESEYSYVLQDWAQALDVEHAFARTAEVLRMILGLNLPVNSLERMNRKMSESVAGFRPGGTSLSLSEGRGRPRRFAAGKRSTDCAATGWRN